MSVLQTLLSLFHDTASQLGSAWSLEVVQQEGEVLVLEAGGQQFVFNKRFRTVKSGAAVLAQFDAIQSIDVTHHRATDDRPEHWAVSLNLTGWFASVFIGKTRNDVDASIAAARISAFTNKKVRAL